MILQQSDSNTMDIFTKSKNDDPIDTILLAEDMKTSPESNVTTPKESV